MRDPASEFRGTPLPRTPVNSGGRGIAPRGALTGGFFRTKPVRVMRGVSGYVIIHS